MIRSLIALLVIAFVPITARAGKDSFEPTKNYVVRQVEGWPVLLHPQLVKDHPKLIEPMLEQLRHQLYTIKRLIPASAVEKVQTVKIWVENFHPLHPCMCYHPSDGWLKGKGCNPDKAKGVEIANPKNFLSWTKDQPFMVLHEMAHAYHHQFLPDGYDNNELRKAHIRMRETKKYDEVLHINGRKQKHYSLTNPMEYFAESTEAYFGTNDFYPFVRAELREFDPEMYELVGKLWKGK